MNLQNAEASKKLSLRLGIVLVIAFLLPVYLIVGYTYGGELETEWKFLFTELEGLDGLKDLYNLFFPLITGILLIVLAYLKIEDIDVGTGSLNLKAILKILVITLPVIFLADRLYVLFDLGAIYSSAMEMEESRMSHGIVFLGFILLFLAGLNFVRDFKSTWAFLIPGIGALFFFIYLLLPSTDDSITAIYLFKMLDSPNISGSEQMVCIVQLLLYLFFLVLFIIQLVNIASRNNRADWVKKNFQALYIALGLYVFFIFIAALSDISDSDSGHKDATATYFFTLYLKLVLYVIPTIIAAGIGPTELVQGLLKKQMVAENETRTTGSI